jgi:hypothetical protein
LVTLAFEKCNNKFWDGEHAVLGTWRGQVDSSTEQLSHTTAFSSTTGSFLNWLGGNSVTWTTSLSLSLNGVNKGKTFGIGV